LKDLIEEDLVNLDDWIRRLRVEYTIFFNGHRKKPPDDLRVRVEKQIKKLSESNLTLAERFQYNTLISRFYILRDQWRRSQASKELGIDRKEELQTKPAAKVVGQAGEQEKGISISISNPENEEEKVRQLYDTLVRLRSQQPSGSPPISYPQFVKYIATQIQGIRNKSQCGSVRFTLAPDSNAVKFTAKGESSK
jgi:hypothetical protein